MSRRASKHRQNTFIPPIYSFTLVHVENQAFFIVELISSGGKQGNKKICNVSNSANQCFFLCVVVSSSCFHMEKIFFYYKALIFLKLFFIRVFVFVRKTHEFSLAQAKFCCWIQKESVDISHKIFGASQKERKKNAVFGGMFCEKFFV